MNQNFYQETTVDCNLLSMNQNKQQLANLNYLFSLFLSFITTRPTSQASETVDQPVKKMK